MRSRLVVLSAACSSVKVCLTWVGVLEVFLLEDYLGTCFVSSCVSKHPRP